MRTLLSLLLVVSLGLACDRPPPEEEDNSLRIEGALVMDNGDPASDLAVRLLRASAEFAQVQTDAAGGYSFEVDSDDVRGSQLSVRVELGAAGASAEVGLDFEASLAKTTLPTLRFLEAPLSHSVETDTVTVMVPNYADGDDRRPDAYQLVASAGSTTVATVETSGSSSTVAIDKLLLEDFDVSLRLYALLAPSAAISGFAASAPASAGVVNAAPLSRGASCDYSSTQDQTAQALSPCPLTDGDLDSGLPTEVTICEDSNPDDAIEECAETWERVTIDLGSEQSITTLVVHGLGSASSVMLKQSTDGTTFTNVTPLTSPDTLLSIALTARYLQLSYTGDATQSMLAGLNEFSAY